jgi:hypothetical protein
MELAINQNNQLSTKGNYHKGEKFFKSLENRIEENKIKGINENYWKDFEANSNKTKSSLLQYKSAVKRFIDANDKDILSISIDELESYLNNFEEGKTKDNQSRYIKSFITYSIEKNMLKASANTNKELILSLIPNEYRMLINVLMNK